MPTLLTRTMKDFKQLGIWVQRIPKFRTQVWKLDPIWSNTNLQTSKDGRWLSGPSSGSDGGPWAKGLHIFWVSLWGPPEVSKHQMESNTKLIHVYSILCYFHVLFHTQNWSILCRESVFRQAADEENRKIIKAWGQCDTCHTTVGDTGKVELDHMNILFLYMNEL